VEITSLTLEFYYFNIGRHRETLLRLWH